MNSKTFFHLLTIMMVAMVFVLFSSCNNDDDNKVNSPIIPLDITVNGKQLVRINSTMNQSNSTTLLQYNSNGQLSKTNNKNDDYKASDFLYSYESRRIIMSGAFDEIFKLNGGRIVESDYTVGIWDNDKNGPTKITTVDAKDTYEYDNNGYLTKVTRPDDYTATEWNSEYSLTWQDGNISKIRIFGNGYDLSEEHVISYTSHPNTIPFIFTDFTFCNVFLGWQGYFGKRCKNLPAKEVVNYNLADHGLHIPNTITFTYDYTIEDGLVTKVIKKWGSQSTTVYELEWY